MKMVLLSAAAVAAVAISPALAQTAPPQVHVMQMQPMTRAAMVQKVQEHFAKLDSNNDGFVTKEEMAAAREQMVVKIKDRVEKRLAEKDIQMPDRAAIFDRLDANHDGSISREEFTSAQPQMHQRRVIVLNEGGTAGAARPMRMGMHRMGMGFGGRLFEMADADKDGRVSLQEATNAAAAHFDKADANHDGTLTPEEMRAGHRAIVLRPGRG